MKIIKNPLLVFLVFFLFLTGCSTLSYIGYRIAPKYPGYGNKKLVLPGLQHPVDVYFDRAGVPHIKAQNLHDLVMATGFIQAKDRFFQMDLMRRIARGRVAELVGDQPFVGGTTVGFDLAMRGWGLERLALQDTKVMKPKTRALMQAYVIGVNAAIKHYKFMEYRLLRIAPEPWKLSDSMAVGRLVAWSITHNWTQEATRLLLALYLGTKTAEKIYPAEPWPGGASLKPRGRARALLPSVVPELAGMFHVHKVKKQADAMPESVGFFSGASNAWVVGGGLSASGKPILAGDPHLAHMVPSMMYQEHLHWNNGDTIGAAIPGIPFVVAGHNRRVAWSITSTVADVVDLCIEKTRPGNPAMVMDTSGKWVPVKRRQVIIRVRKGRKLNKRVFTIRYTHNGPAFNDMYPGVLPAWAPLVTVRTQQRPISESLMALAALGDVGTVQALHDALAHMDAPINTWVAGDVDGNTGLFVVGRIPIRKGYRGTFPVPGWLKKYQWAGSIPYAELPFGQAKGKVVFINSNNLTVDPRYMAHPVCVDAAPTYRFDRIRTMLNATDKHTPVTMEAIQKDIYLNRGRELTPFILHDLEGLKLSAREGKALNLLKKWDFYARAKGGAAAVFFAIYRFAELDSLRNKLDPGAFDFVVGRRYTTNFIDLAIKDRDNPLWDDPATPETENRTMAIRKAFPEAMKYLTKALGPDPEKWQWGRLHYINIHHAFGGKKAIAGFVNLPRTPLGGGLDSVWKTHFDMGNAKAPFRVMAGPVWRMVVDLNDIDHGWWVLDTGESGWPGSPHYKDQFKSWVAGQYVPMNSDWDVVRKRATGEWQMMPKQGK